MESRAIKIASRMNKDANIRIIPGHFATTHSHVNYYIDMAIMKSRQSEAAAAASVLAAQYSNSTYIDTIICIDGCEVIGAYLAEELTNSGIMSMNLHKTMYIVSPETNAGGQLIFRDNVQMMINGKHCLLLLANATTGRTIASAVECVQYYGGIVQGVAALFCASAPAIEGMNVTSIFTQADIGDYQTYDFNECPMCAANQRIDAIVNSYGYSKL